MWVNTCIEGSNPSFSVSPEESARAYGACDDSSGYEVAFGEVVCRARQAGRSDGRARLERAGGVAERSNAAVSKTVIRR